MKYSGHMVINKSREAVVQNFTNASILKHWQDGFLRKELQEGLEWQDGCISKLYYKYGKREMILTETINANHLPDSFEAFYHHKHMDNTMTCSFTVLSEEKTKFNYEFEYVRIDWIVPKLMAILFPGMYCKQGAKWMQQFKEFVENQ